MFQRHGLKGDFLCGDICKAGVFPGPFYQVLLLDVLEHIPVAERKVFVRSIAARCSAGAILLLSLPVVKNRWSSRLNNRLRRPLTQHLSYFRKREEHPFPIPEAKQVSGLFDTAFHLVEASVSTDTVFYVWQRSDDATFHP